MGATAGPVTVRTAVPADRTAILQVVGAAFSGRGHDGGEEAGIVEATWAVGGRDPALELVAAAAGEVVGHVLGAPGDLGGRAVVGVAPLSVAPAWQGRGVGSALMVELLARLDARRHPLAVLLGDPAYYRRFGFEPAGPHGISYRPLRPGDPHFQVRWRGDPLAEWRGEFRYCWEAGGGGAARPSGHQHREGGEPHHHHHRPQHRHR